MESIPRALEIRSFISARDPEVSTLLNSLKLFKGEDGIGAPALARHLRRRATGHNRRVCRRRPNLRLTASAPQKKKVKLQPKHLCPAESPSCAAAPSPLHPHIQAAAYALEHGRHDQANTSASPEGSGLLSISAPAPCHSTRPTNRAMRRRPARLLASAVCGTPACLQLLCPNTPSTQACTFTRTPQERLQSGHISHGGCTSSATTHMELHPPQEQQQQQRGQQQQQEQQQREQQQQEQVQLPRPLESHLWHARRMRMTGADAGGKSQGEGNAGLWGHTLALHTAGRGRGSRSFLHQLRSQCVMHDASYWGCLQLSGDQRDIVDLLEKISDPVSLGQQLDRAEVICGAVEWPLLVYEPDMHQRNPQHQHSHQQHRSSQSHKQSHQQQDLHWQQEQQQQQQQQQLPPSSLRRELAPVRAVWVVEQPEVVDGMQGKNREVMRQQEQKGAGNRAGARSCDAGGWYAHCRLWLWVHAAAFQDVSQAVMEAQAGGAGNSSISVQSLSHRLRRLEVVGGTSDSAVHKVVQAITGSQQDPLGPGTPLTPSNRLWQAVDAARSTSSHNIVTQQAGPGSLTFSHKPQRSRRRAKLGTVVGSVSGGTSAASAARGDLRGIQGGGEGGTGTEPAPLCSSTGGILSRMVMQAERQGVVAIQGERQAAGAGKGILTGGREGGGRGPVEARQPAGFPERVDQAELGGGQSPVEIKPWVWPAECVVGVTAFDPRLLSQGAQPSTSKAACLLEGQLKACAGASPAGSVDAPGVSRKDLHTALRQWPDSGDWTQGAHALLHCSLDASASRSTEDSAAPQTPILPPGPTTLPSRNSTCSPPPAATHPPAPPLSEQGISQLRHHARRSSLLLSTPGSLLQQWQCEGAGQQRQQPQQQQQQQQQQAQLSCPVLLVRRHYRASLVGWSLVLPAGWVMPFWNALSFTGARPAGQSEWRWLAAECGSTCFPWDWPHTPAGARLAEEVALAHARAVSLRPLGKEPKPPGMAYCPWGRLGTTTTAIITNTPTPQARANNSTTPVGSFHDLDARSSCGSGSDSSVEDGGAGVRRWGGDRNAVALPWPRGKEKTRKKKKGRGGNQALQGSHSLYMPSTKLPVCQGESQQLGSGGINQGQVQGRKGVVPWAGWHVAHSLHQLRASLLASCQQGPGASANTLQPSAACITSSATPLLPAGSLASSNGTGRSKGEGTLCVSKGQGQLCSGPRALSKALAAGVLVWAKPSSTSPSSVSLPPFVSGGNQCDARRLMSGCSGHPRGGHQVWAWVRVVGKGRCEEGAQLSVALGFSPQGTSSAGPGTSSIKQNEGTAARLTAPAASAALTGPCDTRALEPTIAASGKEEQREQRVVVGYVVSASPRGVSKPSLTYGSDGLRAHAGYPGGLALCDLAAVWDARADAHCGSAWHGGSRGREVGLDERVVPVALRNPLSTKHRRAELWLVLERVGGVGMTGVSVI